MTTPIGLNLVWASTGGVTNPTDTKYKQGWIAEIPTFQNFNYVLQGIDKAKLAYAERDVYPWQDFIAYQAGARVVAGDIIHTCVTTHNDSSGSNPQDPLLDTTNSYWVTGSVFSSLPNSYANLLPKEGFKIDKVSKRATNNLWNSNDFTINNLSCIMALNNESASYSNLLFGNVRGELVVVDVENITDPDDQSLLPNINEKSYRVFHEGHPPQQSEVAGTIPKEVSDGNLYGRRDDNWEEIASGEVHTVSGDFTAKSGIYYNVSTANITIPTLTGSEIFNIHAVTDNVRILNPTNTIRNGSKVIPSGTNLLLLNGETAVMTATDTNKLEMR